MEREYVAATKGRLTLHSAEHVADELASYHDLVTSGSYIVATDGRMKDLHDVPRGSPDWEWNHPIAAATEFTKQQPDFAFGTARMAI